MLAKKCTRAASMLQQTTERFRGEFGRLNDRANRVRFSTELAVALQGKRLSEPIIYRGQ